MHYFVRMRLASSSRPTAPEDGAPFIERVVLPTLEQCHQLQAAQRIVAGGPTTGADTLLFVVRADSIQELDEVITGLPVWPRMETEIVPLTTFDGHAQALRSKLEDLRLHARDDEAASAEVGPRRLWDAHPR